MLGRFRCRRRGQTAGDTAVELDEERVLVGGNVEGEEIRVGAYEEEL